MIDSTIIRAHITPKAERGIQETGSRPSFSTKTHLRTNADGLAVGIALTPGASDVWAETAYRSKANEKHLADNGLRSRIHRKKALGRPMPVNLSRANGAKSKVRAAVELADRLTLARFPLASIDGTQEYRAVRVDQAEWGPVKRETSNTIRTVLEDWVPPALRDSSMLKWFMERVWGRHIVDLAEFRKRAPFLTPEEYESLYRQHPRVHSGTDNSEACVRRIANSIVGNSVCDVGCGTGYLLSRLNEVLGLTRRVGVDFVFPPNQPKVPGIEYIEAMIEKLPFEDGEIDTVVCTHVLEHILDFRVALTELRRVAKRRVIIVVPQEREGRWTFNPHFNFWPYPESFLRAVHPIPESFECVAIGRDIFYREDKGWTPQQPS